MDETRARGSQAVLTLLFLASAASLVAAGWLATTPPDMPTRAALALPFALLAVPVAAARLTPALRRAAIGSGAGPVALLRHVTLPLCGPFVLPVWLFAAAFIAVPLLPAPQPAPGTWAPYALLVLATYAGLLRHLTSHPAT